MKLKILFYSVLAIIPPFFVSCEKEWLEEKRDLSVIVPKSLTDLQLLLNNDLPLNYDTRGISEVFCDDVYVPSDIYDGLTNQIEKNAYIWSDDLFTGQDNVKEWDVAYQQVLYANVILEALESIERTQSNFLEYDDIRGNVLFFRSRAFLNLVMTFSNCYNKETATTDPGIPLRLSSDISLTYGRASVAECYDRIVKDLTEASQLLPTIPKVKTLSSKPAAYGLLARTYLFMDHYQQALAAADSSYELHNYLMDYNDIDPSARYPFPYMNEEIHIFSNISSSFSTHQRNSNVDSILYSQYSDSDLRKNLFFTEGFDGGFHFRGSYNGGAQIFAATATDEILLIKAECEARLNDVEKAMADLNVLLQKRFKNGEFEPVKANDPEEALKIVLSERRKELLRRGLRWYDLKRLNKEPQFAITLSRTVDGKEYILSPNDPRYVIPIPDYVIQASGINQNVR